MRPYVRGNHNSNIISRAKGQYVDGLRTPVTIHPPEETYHYDDEFFVVIGDWYHTEFDTLLGTYISPSNPEGIEPIPGMFSIYHVTKTFALKRERRRRLDLLRPSRVLPPS
jgi:FtsP/CotA-like multicopper oxidase with cupredoxin domain